jgi:hypothetical protein
VSIVAEGALKRRTRRPSAVLTMAMSGDLTEPIMTAA